MAAIKFEKMYKLILTEAEYEMLCICICDKISDVGANEYNALAKQMTDALEL